jgi:hypothetical protein
MSEGKEYLTRAEAADFCQALGFPCTKATLDKLATVGGGPAFQKFGPGRNSRVRYTRENLKTWIQSRLTPPRSSSSQAA